MSGSEWARLCVGGKKASPRTDSGAVGHDRALELLALDEAAQEDREPLFYGRQVVFMASLRRYQVGPASPISVTPCLVGKVGERSPTCGRWWRSPAWCA
jgi:hypothetical protein